MAFGVAGSLRACSGIQITPGCHIEAVDALPPGSYDASILPECLPWANSRLRITPTHRDMDTPRSAFDKSRSAYYHSSAACPTQGTDSTGGKYKQVAGKAVHHRGIPRSSRITGTVSLLESYTMIPYLTHFNQPLRPSHQAPCHFDQSSSIHSVIGRAIRIRSIIGDTPSHPGRLVATSAYRQQCSGNHRNVHFCQRTGRARRGRLAKRFRTFAEGSLLQGPRQEPESRDRAKDVAGGSLA